MSSALMPDEDGLLMARACASAERRSTPGAAAHATEDRCLHEDHEAGHDHDEPDEDASAVALDPADPDHGDREGEERERHGMEQGLAERYLHEKTVGLNPCAVNGPLTNARSTLCVGPSQARAWSGLDRGDGFRPGRAQRLILSTIVLAVPARPCRVARCIADGGTGDT